MGDWVGKATVLGSEVPLSANVRLEDGALHGTLNTSMQQVQNVAFTAELLEDGQVRFVIPDQDPPLTFVGVLEGDVITGSFRVGILGGRFMLERAAPDS